MMRATIAVSMVVLTWMASEGFCASGIDAVLVGGGEEVTDWVVEQQLDTAAAARLLGCRVPEDRERLAVVEVDEAGEVLGVKCSQADEGETPGSLVVSWLVDGRLSPGQTRVFRIELDSQRDSPEPTRAVSANVEGTKCVIRNAPWTVTHDADMGGFISELRIDGEGGPTHAPLTWNDKIYDGKVYTLAHHKASGTRLLAGGPLRVVYELRQPYRGPEGLPASCPEAVYRWTSLAGQPLTRVDATITQEYAKPWGLGIIEIHFDKAPITHATTDKQSTPGNFMTNHWGNEWSAVFGEHVLIAALRARGNGVYGGRSTKGGYGSYLRASPSERWSDTQKRWQPYLFWGEGANDLDEVRRWNRILAEPPRITLRLAPLEQQIVGLEEDLAEVGRTATERSAAEQARRGAARRLSETALNYARKEAQAGRFANAQRACADAKAVLSSLGASGEVRATGDVTAGLVNGHAFLENGEVSFVFAGEQKGGGLLSIRDRATDREFLEADFTGAPFWRVALRRKQGGGVTLASESVPCEVSVTPDAQGEGSALVFDWTDLSDGEADDIGSVRVVVSLRKGEAFARSRIEVQVEHDDYGLSQVVFPEVAGIAALTPDAAEDHVLDTREVGDCVASPLRSGTNVLTNYPFGMQFNAVYGGGWGLYFAEEDPDACSKQIEFAPDATRGTLTFRIAHPVLNYGAPELVKEYRCPGDVVMGPFRGDWYDACRIYRRWAVESAPWCANGPIAANKDFPKWLADASYWTIDYADNEKHTEERVFGLHEFFGVPGHVLWLSSWSFSYCIGHESPEYFPPRLGPENFASTIRRWQEAGMRVVPYVSGYLWATDTESYRTKDVVTNGALLDARGKERIANRAGQKTWVAMCPGSNLWRQTLLEISKELVGRYGVDGIYFDFLSAQNQDCLAPQHGHPLGGGNFWSKSVQDLYRLIRTECKAINPDCMLTGENIAEPFIGLHDTFYCTQGAPSRAPLFMAVYHDYSLVYAGQRTDLGPINTGKSFILGKQNGWYDIEGRLWGRYEEYKREADYYRMLLQCHDRFARPYLSYGEMLRMPKVAGELPTIKGKGLGGYELPAIEGTAWRAPDGRVGVFFANYDETPHEFSWELDLAEAAGWDSDTMVRLSQWTPEGVKGLGRAKGGVLRRRETLEGWGLLALELEVER